jgi:O-antigen/teichoic acid export membrane protein
MKHAAGAARPVLVGLVVLAISSYLTLILAGRILGAAQFSGIAALYALLTAVATGLFQPIEQEISRRRGREWETHSAERTLVVRAARIALGLAAGTIALALLLNHQAVGLLGHEPQLLAAFCVGLPGYALCFVVRGMLAGNRQLNRYGIQLAVEGTSRLLGLAVLAFAGVSSSVAYGWLFAAAPWIAVAACLVGWRPGHQASQPAPAVPLLAPLSLLLISALSAQLLIGAGPLTAQLFATAADQARVGAFLAALVVVRLPVLLFTAVQPSLLPSLSAHAAVGRRKEFRTLLAQVLAGTVAVGLVNLAGIVLLGPWFLRVAFGGGFTLSAALLALMSVSVGLFLMALVLGQGVLALGNHRGVTAAWLSGLAGLAIGIGFGTDPVVRATLGLLVGAAFVVVSFGGLLWRSTRRQESVEVRPLPDPFTTA